MTLQNALGDIALDATVAAGNTKLDTIAGNQTTQTSRLANIDGATDASAASLDSIDTKHSATNTKLDTLIADDAVATASGSITTQNLVPAGAATANSAVEITLGGRDTLLIQVTGTYTGALSIQGTVNGTVWVTLSGASRILNHNTGAYSATIASAAQSIFETSVSGLLKVRVTGLAAMTGTATVSLLAADGNAQVAIDTALPAGSAVIGAVTQSGTWNIGAVSTSVTPGVAAGNLGKAEDAAHASGDTGVAVWGVRNDNAASADFGANNDYTPIATDQKGAVFTREKPNATAALTNVSSSATSVTVLASNAARRGATIVNDSTQVLYLKFGATASATSYTVKLVADAYYEVPFGYTGIIDGIWASANGNARVTEVTS